MKSLLRELYDMTTPSPSDEPERTQQPPSHDVKSYDSEDNRPGEHDNTPDTISVDIPLLIRLLEWAREESNDDVELHEIATNLTNMQGKTLTMDDYYKIVGEKDEADEEDNDADVTPAPDAARTDNPRNPASQNGYNV
jgi:hypothetical protein